VISPEEGDGFQVFSIEEVATDPRFAPGLAYLQRQAAHRGFECTLTEQQYRSIRAELCIYCRGWLPPDGHGLDRIDGRRGYSIDNVVPSCKHCNSWRGAGNKCSSEQLRKIMELYRLRVGPTRWPDPINERVPFMEFKRTLKALRRETAGEFERRA
jgi:hypothetical protein